MSEAINLAIAAAQCQPNSRRRPCFPQAHARHIYLVGQRSPR
ncbi:hypothetical protein PLANPX_1539 [Lacipirellula parvula]|uniref:Uncharacterized protein n=1 Tax=Lacipirellula parvula TaxID=2650471 RepID=A0A5K7X7Z5_9BACT|nr:hypothetical protein PLANPX_1539 [Lacipirellula parvula]